MLGERDETSRTPQPMTYDLSDWPTDLKQAERRYRALVLSLVERYGFTFGEASPDPIQLVRDFLRGERSSEDLEQASQVWQDFAFAPERLGDFRSRDALEARLAITLLRKMRADEELENYLSWLVELFGYLGYRQGVRDLVYARQDQT